MAKYTTARDIKAIGIAKLAKPNASEKQQEALADAILALNGFPKGHVFKAGSVVRLGEGINVKPSETPVVEPFAAPVVPVAPVEAVPVAATPVAATPAPAAAEWTLAGDPVYQAAMGQGASQFNLARAGALGNIQNQQTQAAGQRQQIDTTAQENRRRLAGNFAARGMAGGATGALSQSEAQLNAQQIAQRTSITDQIESLNRDYLSKFGATGTDWTGTQYGQEYKTQAAQAAINSQLAKYGAM